MSDDGLKQHEDFLYAWLVTYREARGEPMGGQIAVVYTLLNRAERPKWWGKTIASCAIKAWQYSSLTDPKDPQLSKAWPTLSTEAGLATARVADEVLRGTVANPFPGADSYYDDSFKGPHGETEPFWVPGSRFCGKIGKLNFYDVDHDWEAPVTGHV